MSTWSVSEEQINELRAAQAEARGPGWRIPGKNRLDQAVDNLAGQAVNWMSEHEVRGHGVPVDMALWDAADRDAFGPWLTAEAKVFADEAGRYETQPDDSYFQAEHDVDGS